MRKDTKKQKKQNKNGNDTFPISSGMQKEDMPTTKTSSLATSVLKRIETEQVVPSSRCWFMVLESSMWVLWALTVTFGAIAVSVMEYIGENARFALREATHSSTFSFCVDKLPYVWLILFVLMAGLAYVNIRHTRHGYRYQLYHILLSSIILSIVGGTLLHVVGVGSAIDARFGKQIPMYKSVQEAEVALWQQPDEGRLIGTFVGMDPSDTQYMFEDTAGGAWTIETAELRQRDTSLLMSGNTVRMVGMVTDKDAHQFYACGVFPWMVMQKGMPAGARRVSREEFLEGMQWHKEKGKELKKLEREVYGEDVPMPFSEGKCGELAAVKRMRY